MMLAGFMLDCILTLFLFEKEFFKLPHVDSNYLVKYSTLCPLNLRITGKSVITFFNSHNSGLTHDGYEVFSQHNKVGF